MTKPIKHGDMWEWVRQNPFPRSMLSMVIPVGAEAWGFIVYRMDSLTPDWEPVYASKENALMARTGLSKLMYRREPMTTNMGDLAEWVGQHPFCRIDPVYKDTDKGYYGFHVFDSGGGLMAEPIFNSAEEAEQARQHLAAQKTSPPATVFPGPMSMWQNIVARTEQLLETVPNPSITAPENNGPAWEIVVGDTLLINFDTENQANFYFRWVQARLQITPAIESEDNEPRGNSPLGAVYKEGQQRLDAKETGAMAFLRTAMKMLDNRGQVYDKGSKQERSMVDITNLFNSITGRHISVTEGWLFMICLKLTRLSNAPSFHYDSAVDLVAYAALMVEEMAAKP